MWPGATAWLATPRRLGELAVRRLSSGRSAEARLHDVAVLADALGTGAPYGSGSAATQMWGRQPG